MGSAIGADHPATAATVSSDAVTDLPTGWRSLHLRLIAVVNLAFMATMCAFLTASFLAERDLHYQETLDHLEETLGILADWDRFTDRDGAAVVEVERQLAARTGVIHRLLVTDSAGRIVAASSAGLIGGSLEDAFTVVPFGGDDRFWGAGEGSEWLAASIAPSPPGSGRILLLRERSGSERFVAGFLRLHGLHLLVTLGVFTLLLYWIGMLHVRRPVEKLARSIERLEAGDFRVDLEAERSDEIGWLTRRFARMAKLLREAVNRRVRAEKLTSASVVAYRAVRELEEPLHALERHVVYLEGLSGDDSELRRLGNDFRRDRLQVLAALRRLSEIVPDDLERGNSATEPSAADSADARGPGA